MKTNVNRRNFIKTAGLAASGLSLGLASSLRANTLPHNEAVKIGVIGTGSRGTGLIRTMQKIPNLQVVAGCDVLPFRLDHAMKFAEENAARYSDYRELLEDKNLDAVLISTPLSFHKDMAFDAIDAGKHVYLEKSMTKGIDESLALVEKVKASDRIFQVGHQYHSSPLYANIVRTIQKGYIGEIKSFDAQWNRNGDWRRMVPEENLERQINWRMYREFSNGLLGELSSHQIDFVNWVTDAHPEKVVGTGGIDYWKDGRETFDNIHVIFDYPKGVKASFTCLTSNAYEGYQIKVQGDKATIVIKPTSALIYPESATKKELGMVDGVSGATIPTMNKEGAIPVNGSNDDPSGKALIDFAESVINNTEPISNVKTGAKAAISVRMALDSMIEQKSIEWQDSYNIS